MDGFCGTHAILEAQTPSVNYDLTFLWPLTFYKDGSIFGIRIAPSTAVTVSQSRVSAIFYLVGQQARTPVLNCTVKNHILSHGRPRNENP